MRPIRILSAIAACALTLGCGSSAMRTARGTLAIGAVAVREVSEANAEAMAQTRTADIDASATAGDYDERRVPYWRLEAAGRIARSALLMTERILDTAGVDGLLNVARCLTAAFVELADAVHAVDSIPGVDLPIPTAVLDVVRWARVFGGTCEPQGGGAS